MKIFVFAVQCGGKTTLANYLRDISSFEIVEMDDEIMQLNGDSWPRNMRYKVMVLEPIVYQEVSAKQDIVFMDNHMSIEQAKKLKEAGFKTVLLEVGRTELMRRNTERVESGDQSDASKWIDMELANVELLRGNHLIDLTIDGEQSTEKVAKEFLAYLAKG